MFMSADIVVKAVMLGLIFASMLTWTIWLAKTLELFGVRRRLRRAQRSLTMARSLAEAAPVATRASGHVALLIQAVEAELNRSADRRDVEGVKERITARFERIEAAVGRKMLRATGILATIGATAPFVGLFGTVWGIMNSFIGISKLHTTNLAVVAPGIAEALLATAFGLAAAIPAVVIYNMFARSIGHYRALYADASVEILTLVSRDLELSLDPVRASELEVEWWRLHREHQHDPDVLEEALVQSLVDLYAYVYDVAPESVRDAARFRVEAMDHSDAWVANGCDLADPLLTQERRALVASHTALRHAVGRD